MPIEMKIPSELLRWSWPSGRRDPDGSVFLPRENRYLDGRVQIDRIVSAYQLSPISERVIAFQHLQSFIHTFSPDPLFYHKLLLGVSHRSRYLSIYPRHDGQLIVLRHLPSREGHFRMIEKEITGRNWNAIMMILSRPQLIATGHPWSLNFQRYLKKKPEMTHRHTIIQRGRTIKLDGCPIPEPVGGTRYDVEHFLYDLLCGDNWYEVVLLSQQFGCF